MGAIVLAGGAAPLLNNTKDNVKGGRVTIPNLELVAF